MRLKTTRMQQNRLAEVKWHKAVWRQITGYHKGKALVRTAYVLHVLYAQDLLVDSWK